MESNFTNQSRYIVSSSFIACFDFGTLTLGATELNAVLVTFRNGSEYIYFGMNDEVINSIEAACIRNAENQDERVGNIFNQTLRQYQCYARLNSNI